MSETAREAILERLRRARGPNAHVPDADFGVLERKSWPGVERYRRLRRLMEAIRAEFVETTEDDWPLDVLRFAAAEELRTVVYGPRLPETERLASTWSSIEPAPRTRLVPYGRPLEADQWKRELFDEMDAGFTTTRGGIAETGGLILWPSPEEPRLLSLVPPVHLALLDTGRIHDTFWHAMRAEAWARGMPPNALLVSGPSKTADIEQTLAYGVHGPKRLVVFAIVRSA